MQWFFAGSPQQVGAAVQQRPATSFAPAGSGSNRGPLAFVDSIFGETEGELHSMLGEWEEQLEAMQQDDAPPQAMHVSLLLQLLTLSAMLVMLHCCAPIDYARCLQQLRGKNAACAGRESGNSDGNGRPHQHARRRLPGGLGSLADKLEDAEAASNGCR